MSQTPKPPAPTTFNKRAIAAAVASALVVMLFAESLRIFVGSNFHNVVAGKCYRSAQPTDASLTSLRNTHRIRSIINLRDENPDEKWYQAEKGAADRLGIELFNAGLATKEQPPAVDFHRFVQAMKDAPEPILIHCANGNDRTGLAAAFYLLMRTDTTLADARRQLSLRYGHFAVGKTLCLHRILDSYETWLHETGQSHHPDRLYEWGMRVYEQEDPER